MQKRSVTLVELLVGCTLLSLLLTLVFGIVGELQKSYKVIDNTRDELAERIKLESSLDQLFLKLTPLKEGDEPGFYTDKEGGLVFTSQIGAGVDPLFVDRVLCKLYCNSDGFVVDQWPDPERHGVYPTQMRREILLSGATEVSWQFFVPPNPNLVIEIQKIGNDTDEQAPPSDWNTTWKPGYKKIPPLLQLTLKRGSQKYVYETYLPATSYVLELPQ